METVSAQEVVALDLRYDNEVIASYEFNSLGDANDFLVQMALTAKRILPGVTVRCQVTTSAMVKGKPPE